MCRWKKDSAANMKDIESVQQLVNELVRENVASFHPVPYPFLFSQAAAGDKLVIVEFYAPW